MKEIFTTHLEFVQEAKQAFDADPTLYTWRNDPETLIALRYGADRDCILVYELGPCIANFVEQAKPAPLWEEVIKFSFDMQMRLLANRAKDVWKRSDENFLFEKMMQHQESLHEELSRANTNKRVITILCADIANYAMMIADNEGEHL